LLYSQTWLAVQLDTARCTARHGLLHLFNRIC